MVIRSRTKVRLSALRVAAVVALSWLSWLSCGQAVQAEDVYGVIRGGASGQQLLKWDTANAAAIIATIDVIGIELNETLLGIDFRPANNLLYGIGSTRRLYQINTTSGAATAIGTTFAAVVGANFGFDFNPTIDRSRLVSDADTNYVINPNDGTLTVATNLLYPVGDPNAGKNPNVVDIAYNHNFAGATTTQLYAIDSTLGILAGQTNSFGVLNTVGSLGLTIDPVGGFDISPSGMAYAAFIPVGFTTSSFYQINLTTGAASLVGQIGNGTQVITGLAIQSVAIPEPTGLWVMGAIVGLIGMRRKR